MAPLPKLPVPVPAPVPAPTPSRSTRAALSAIVVAGGRSSRLDGSPKALMRRPGGRELVHEATAALLELGLPAQRIVVVGPQDLPLPAGVLRTREEPPFSGPASALAAGASALALAEPTGAFESAESSGSAGSDDPAAEGAADAAAEPDEQWTLTLACDMPRVADAARALIAEIEALGTSLEPSPAAETTSSNRTGSAPLETPRGIVLTDRGTLQPLAAAYRSAALGRHLADQPVVDRSVRGVLGSLWDRQLAVRGLTDDIDTWDDVHRFGLVPDQD